jgi:hypothetical protein
MIFYHPRTFQFAREHRAHRERRGGGGQEKVMGKSMGARDAERKLEKKG